jgi:hypothetical protein
MATKVTPARKRAKPKRASPARRTGRKWSGKVMQKSDAAC